jgi:hypothetical protein
MCDSVAKILCLDNNQKVGFRKTIHCTAPILDGKHKDDFSSMLFARTLKCERYKQMSSFPYLSGFFFR